MKVRVIVKLKDEVLDPQGQAIHRALLKMGHEEVLSVRQGRCFELELNGANRSEIRQTIQKISSNILSNPLIENFEIEEIG